MHVTSLLAAVLYRGTFRAARKIMTTSNKMQMENLQKNPYYDKYAKKIKQLRNENPETFESRLEQTGTVKNERKTVKTREYSQLLTPKERMSQPALVKKESLDSVMKTDLIENKSTNEIKSIWEQYHLQKEYTLAATIPATDFDKLSENGKKFPTFLFALPRSQGYEFIMCQFAQNTVHFTPLLYYQVHKENAPECLTLTHYDELRDSKGIVLMKGEYNNDIIDAKEAQCLANQLQMYYVQDEPEKIKLLDTFTNKPDEFKHIDLIKQIENLSLK